MKYLNEMVELSNMHSKSIAVAKARVLMIKYNAEYSQYEVWKELENRNLMNECIARAAKINDEIRPLLDKIRKRAGQLLSENGRIKWRFSSLADAKMMLALKWPDAIHSCYDSLSEENAKAIEVDFFTHKIYYTFKYDV